jgi:hypothetical protein
VSCDLAPLPDVYLGMVNIWLISIICWIVSWMRHKHDCVFLQRWLTVVPLIQVVTLAASYRHWLTQRYVLSAQRPRSWSEPRVPRHAWAS